MQKKQREKHSPCIIIGLVDLFINKLFFIFFSINNFHIFSQPVSIDITPVTQILLYNNNIVVQMLDLCQYLGHEKLNFFSPPNKLGDVILSCKSLIFNLLWCLVTKGTVTPFLVVK